VTTCTCSRDLFHNLGEKNLLLKFCKIFFSINFATWKFSTIAKKVSVGTSPSSYSCSIVNKNASLWPLCDLWFRDILRFFFSCSMIDKIAFLRACDSRTSSGSSSHLTINKNASLQACDFQTCGSINISAWNTHSYLHAIGDSFTCSSINSISILRSSKLGTSSCSDDISPQFCSSHYVVWISMEIYFHHIAPYCS